MVEVALSQLQADLPSLVETARRGETVVILEGGKPVARLVPPLQDEARPAWRPSGDDFADRARQIRERFAGDVPPMTDAEFQAEIDVVKGRV